jgi:hypothetical protein
MVVFLDLLQDYLNYHPEMSLGLILWENYIPVHSQSAQELTESLWTRTARMDQFIS